MSRKRLALVATAFVLTALPTGCGNSGGTLPEAEPPPPGAGEQLTNADWARVVANPAQYKGAAANLVGRVFSVDNSDDGSYRALHVWADVRHSSQETTVIARRGIPILTGDYLSVRGLVQGKVDDETFGVDVRGPVVIASRVVRVTAIAAASPARQRLRAKPYTVFAVTLTPYRIDFAQDEARVFLRIKNATDYTIHYDAADSYLLSDGVRFKARPPGSYPRIPSDIFPGATVTGVTTFAPVSPGTSFKFVTKFSSDDDSLGLSGVTTPILWTWSF
jgi:hypothetical protein